MADNLEGWILAGELDGVGTFPALTDDVCGIPHVLRLACDLAVAGATTVYVIWNLDGELPELDAVARDPRLAARAKLEVVRAPPHGNPRDSVIVARGDRLFHRDLPKLVLAARARGAIGVIEGHDAVFAADRATASRLIARARAPRGIASAFAFETSIAAVPPPYAGFTARASGPRTLRVAERQLVWSLRKAADGLASKAINRHISLRLSLRLARTRVHPNHVTLAAIVLAIAGGIVIGSGGYLAAVVGMLLVNTGSIIDGVDGELARLRYQFSQTGQWLDTVGDDIANVAYVSGTAASLAASGATWALPLGGCALGAFAVTQLSQYALIRYVYRSGDLAAIPWAFQSAQFLTRRPSGVRAWIATTLPKCLKRDFVVALFLVLAIAGRLDVVLVVFSAGAFAFLGVFLVQLVRHRRELPALAVSGARP